MKRSERAYANVILQLLSLFFVTVYFIFTLGAFPLNYIWFIVAVLLGLVGVLRKINEALLASLIAILVYAAILVYSMYTSRIPVEIGWNDLVWLCVFPFLALMGGLHKGMPDPSTFVPKQSSLSKLNIHFGDEIGSVPVHSTLDEKLGYSDEAGLTGWLNKELPRIVRSGRELTLLTVGVTELDSFRSEYGQEQTDEFMNRIGELINYVIGPVEAKALLAGDLFAVAFVGKEQLSPKMAQLELSEQFNSMLLTRPRRERNIKLRLKYGAADSNQHGQDAAALLKQAKAMLKP